MTPGDWSDTDRVSSRTATAVYFSILILASHLLLLLFAISWIHDAFMRPASEDEWQNNQW